MQEFARNVIYTMGIRCGIRRIDMQELEKLGKIMDVIIDTCCDCPLEKICSSYKCNIEWERFFQSKIKEDGLE